MTHIFIIAALLLYVIASGLSVGALSKNGEKLGKLGEPVFLLALLAQSLSLFILLINGEITLTGNSGDYYFLLSWALPLFIAIRKKKFGFPVIRASVSGIAAILLVSSSILVHGGAASSTGVTPLLILHVVSAMLSEVMLLGAGVVAGTFLLQQRRLKSKSFDLVVRKGPSLDSLGAILRKFIGGGFLLMTLAVLTGVLWGWSEHRSLLSPDVVTWAALASWVLQGFILHGAQHHRWSSGRVARVTIYLVLLFILSLSVVLLTRSGDLHG